MATGSMTLTGRVSSSSADYFGNGTQNGMESLLFHCDLSGTKPPANCVTFSITSVTFSINVVTATQGAVITADYFNTNVLNKVA